jgi:hypothetical protein
MNVCSTKCFSRDVADAVTTGARRRSRFWRAPGSQSSPSEKVNSDARACRFELENHGAFLYKFAP